MVMSIVSQPVPMREAREQFVAALRDPGLSAQDLVELSRELEPFSAFDPGAFLVFKQASPGSGRPLCGGPAEVPELLQAFNPGAQGSSAFWVGTSRDLGVIVPELNYVLTWSWKDIPEIRKGRKIWKFGAVHVNLLHGNRFKMRLPAYQMDLLLAVWQRFR